MLCLFWSRDTIDSEAARSKYLTANTWHVPDKSPPQWFSVISKFVFSSGFVSDSLFAAQTCPSLVPTTLRPRAPLFLLPQPCPQPFIFPVVDFNSLLKPVPLLYTPLILLFQSHNHSLSLLRILSRCWKLSLARALRSFSDSHAQPFTCPAVDFYSLFKRVPLSYLSLIHSSFTSTAIYILFPL